MAAIRETLILEDKFTSTMTQCLQVAQRMANMLDDVRASTMNVETAAAATAVQMQELAGKMTQTNSRGTSLLGTIRNLAGTFLGMQSVRWLVNTSDQLTSINARLRLMTGSAEAAAAAQEEIYQAAMRSRGAYADMADFVSQLGTVAGKAFTGTDELVAFAEQIQKQMAISGASGASAQAALVQLTQGLASGTLRGEELNSVLEQTPMIAQTIAEYMGVTIGEMRELASEGKVTAEVVKNAMLGAAEETNAQFEQMPMTWAQVWTMFQNVAIQALDPVLDAISWLANNIDLVGPIVLGLGTAFGVFLLAANWTNICTAATTVLTTAQKMLREVMATTWGLPLIIIALVIGAIYAVTAAVNHFAGTSVSATGIIAGAVLTVAAIIGNTVIGLLNGIIQAVWSIFVTPFLGIIEWVLNVTNGGFDSFGGAVANLIGNIISWFLDLGKVVTKIIDAIFGTNWTAGLTSLQDSVLKWGKNENAITLDRNAPTIDYRFNYGDAWNTGYNWGANLFSGNGNDAVGAALSGVPYDELSGQLGDIAGSVGSIEKSVKMSDEDIKSLVDVAERRYVNNVNLTAQTPVITVNGANTGRTAADRQSLANAIRDILIEQTASGSTRSTARPASG
ncbi:tape measure protein [Flavonifractor plautii]|jgi:tape measure domain-containing protein|uniref:tape measure protein n=1 Tax=Flavonifractor plautii TaxID=292800 RepID=UPI0006C15384|nr:tape measure protein [Flavonifractor plautii]MSB86134.1 tape measure protein [Flavonifractor plautii]CUQ26039.1 Phage-related minor tail protein [Flavonifractor plautii]